MNVIKKIKKKKAMDIIRMKYSKRIMESVGKLWLMMLVALQVFEDVLRVKEKKFLSNTYRYLRTEDIYA